MFCCVKGGLSGGGKHVFGARKRCFAAADMVFSAVNTVKKTLKRRILLHKTPLCAVTSAMSGSYVCTRFLPVFVPCGLLFFNGGLLTLQGNSMCKPPGRLRLHCVRRGCGAETNSWERGRPQLRCISNHDNMASMTYAAARKLTMRNEKFLISAKRLHLINIYARERRRCL